MSPKYYVILSLALLSSYEHLAQAADFDGLKEFGFIQITEHCEEVPFDKALEMAAPEGCKILVDAKIIPKRAEKVTNKIIFTKRKKPSAINQLPPFDPELRVTLLAAIQIELDRHIIYAVIQSMTEAEAMIDKLCVDKLPLPQLKRLPHGLARLLWRGCRLDQLTMSLVYGSAGGEEVNIDTPKPTEDDAQKQVAEILSLPEFTDSATVLASFGTNSFQVAFIISDKYLTHGSGSENGFICLKSAPVEVIGIMNGRKLVL